MLPASCGKRKGIAPDILLQVAFLSDGLAVAPPLSIAIGSTAVIVCAVGLICEASVRQMTSDDAIRSAYSTCTGLVLVHTSERQLWRWTWFNAKAYMIMWVAQFPDREFSFTSLCFRLQIRAFALPTFDLPAVHMYHSSMLQFRFYRRRAATPEQWKVQPKVNHVSFVSSKYSSTNYTAWSCVQQ